MSEMKTSAGAAMIEADGLTKYYGSFIAIEDVSFRVPRGEVVAFLGPNGAGKSTTMKILTGYLAPTAGTSRIAGHDMSTDRLAGAERLGYLKGGASDVIGHSWLASFDFDGLVNMTLSPPWVPNLSASDDCMLIASLIR
jgi:ABC-type uncharacterized transport system ATPase subunit